MPRPRASGSATASQSDAILFPSRHFQQITCFDAPTLLPIGSVSKDQTASGALARSGSGIAVAAGPRDAIVCRALFSGPAVLTALRLSQSELKQTNDLFHRHSGLLEGGLATLAAFVLITAIINRDWVYVLFAAWLFGNLRLGAISMGWDEQWLGSPIPLNWVSLIRKITVPVYYILTWTLFQALFKNDLPRVGHKRLLRTIQWLGPGLLVASIVLAVRFYLPLMWSIARFSIAVAVLIVGRLLTLPPSRTALWYTAPLALALLPTFSL